MISQPKDDAQNPTEASQLPSLSFQSAAGFNTETPSIDYNALVRFARQHQLPTIPDLNRVSADTARDVFGALKAVEAHPEGAVAWGQLGRVFHSHQYLAEAMECYAMASAHAPGDYEWPYYMGRIYADRYQYEPAIAAYERAAELNPTYASTFLALGNLHLQSGNKEKARESFSRLAKLQPQLNHGYLGLAQIAFDSRDFKNAIKLLSDAASRNPEDFRAHSLLGQAYQHIGEAQKARHHLAIVQSLNRRDQRAKHVVFDDPLYHEMLASNTTDAAVRERLQAALGTGQFEVAIRLAEQLCRRQPKDAARVHLLAVAHKQANNYEAALERVERALSLDSSLTDAHLTKAQLLIILRRHREAVDLLDWIVAKNPKSFNGHYYRGAAQVLSGQYDAAVESFRHAIQLDDNSAPSSRRTRRGVGRNRPAGRSDVGVSSST